MLIFRRKFYAVQDYQLNVLDSTTNQIRNVADDAFKYQTRISRGNLAKQAQDLRAKGVSNTEIKSIISNEKAKHLADFNSRAKASGFDTLSGKTYKHNGVTVYKQNYKDSGFFGKLFKKKPNKDLSSTLASLEGNKNFKYSGLDKSAVKSIFPVSSNAKSRDISKALKNQGTLNEYISGSNYSRQLTTDTGMINKSKVDQALRLQRQKGHFDNSKYSGINKGDYLAKKASGQKFTIEERRSMLSDKYKNEFDKFKKNSSNTAPKPTSTPKIEAPKPTSTPKIEAPKPTSTPKIEAPKPMSTPKIEAPKPISTPKIEAPKSTSTPKIEAPKSTSTPKIEVPKPKPTSTPTSSVLNTTKPGFPKVGTGGKLLMGAGLLAGGAYLLNKRNKKKKEKSL